MPNVTLPMSALTLSLGGVFFGRARIGSLRQKRQLDDLIGDLEYHQMPLLLSGPSPLAHRLLASTARQPHLSK